MKRLIIPIVTLMAVGGVAMAQVQLNLNPNTGTNPHNKKEATVPTPPVISQTPAPDTSPPTDAPVPEPTPGGPQPPVPPTTDPVPDPTPAPPPPPLQATPTDPTSNPHAHYIGGQNGGYSQIVR